MKKIVSILSLCVLFVSCGETENKVWDPNTGQTLAYFASTSGVLGVPFNSTTTQTVKINVNTLSSVDRTVMVEVDEANTTVDGANYAFSPTVTIPANSYIGDLVITGTDTEELTTAPELLVLKITSVSDGGVVAAAKLTLTVQQICPLPAGFATGDYLLTQVNPIGGDGPILENNVVRPVVAHDPANPLARRFTTFNFPNFCSTTRNNFTFQLICGKVIIPAGNTSNCICTQGVPYIFGAPTVNATFDPTDDSVITITFTDDETLNCGTTQQMTYTLTKQ
ncbi:MAG: hypothetical protein WD512_06640 [Candidatus Paceibacterota bacterium]